MTSALVAAPVDVTSPYAGLLVIESGADLKEAIESGDWVAGTLAGVSLAFDTLSTVIDPLGTAIAMGVGWVLDHIEPLKSWFNDLTGDAGEVAGFAQTWSNVSQYLKSVADGLREQLEQVSDLSGETMRAFRNFHLDTAKHVELTADWANAMSIGLQIASGIVQFVHGLVRDAISTIIGSLSSATILSVCTLGAGVPLAVSQVASKASALATRISRSIDDLITSITNLSRHLRALRELIERVNQVFSRALRNTPTRVPASGKPRSSDAGAPRIPDGTSVSKNAPEAPRYDPDAPVRKTESARNAPRRYTAEDVQRTLDEAPRNAQGQPVDHRNGRPLQETNAAGNRGWHMKYDPESGRFVAENPGNAEPSVLPETGEPNSYGYDADGNRLPYANHRPGYADGQTRTVWETAREQQLDDIRNGRIDLEEPKEDGLWIEPHPTKNREGKDIVRTADGREWYQVHWDKYDPEAPRDWHMAHNTGQEYAPMHDRYLNHEMTPEEFLEWFQKSSNYQPSDPIRNMSHIDEQKPR